MAVEAFLAERLPFPGIPAVVERALEALPAEPVGHFDDLLAADAEARARAAELVADRGVPA